MNRPPFRQNSTVSPLNESTSTRSEPRLYGLERLAGSIATRSSTGSSGCFARVLEDGDDDPIEDGGRPADDVEMAVRDRVERTRIDRDASLAFALLGRIAPVERQRRLAEPALPFRC